MKEIKKFTIDRKIWLRGEGTDKSKLLRSSDGKMCCLGIYLKKCGVKPTLLNNLASPRQVGIPIPNWLLNTRGENSMLVDSLMEENDRELVTEKMMNLKEREIRGLFKEAGIKVTFKG